MTVPASDHAQAGVPGPVPGGCWAVIHNPAARTASPRRLETVLQALRSVGLDPLPLPTTHPGHATELARALRDARRHEGREIAGVAVFGGDGTLSEAATGLLGGELPLAFLPGGTANVLALALGIPRDPVKAALALPRGRALPVRPGTLDGRVFLLVAGFGFDALAVHRVRPGLKRLAGKGAYVWSGLGALLQPPPHLRMENEAGERWEGVWAMAMRSEFYAGNHRGHPDAGLLHPQLGLVMVRQRGVLPYLAGQLGLNLGHRLPWTDFTHGTACKVTSDVPMTVQVDGDAFPGGSEFHLGLAAETLPLVFGPERQA